MQTLFDRLRDFAREAAIRWHGWHVAHAKGDDQLLAHWRKEVELVSGRSPAQIRRMERALGLSDESR